jgi:hypothetical protein
LQSQRWTRGWTEPLYFRHYGDIDNKEDLDLSLFLSNNLFGFIVFSFTFDIRALTHIIYFCGNWFCIAKERCRRSSLIKHQIVCKLPVLQHWHFLILDPAATFTVVLVFCLNFTASKSVMFTAFSIWPMNVG